MTGKIHHLNCGTLNPFSSRFLFPTDGIKETRFLVNHCLLVETGKGLVLIDTGIGRQDIERTDVTLGKTRPMVVQPALLTIECAINHVERLGYTRDDVRHIALTHMDFLQTGGLSDFPNATIHVMRREFEAACDPQTLLERWRYLPTHWQHSAKWKLHSFTGGLWKGFEFSPLFPENDDILLVNLPGHSRGHAGVAIRKGSDWLLHCGDAVLSATQIKTPNDYSFNTLLSASIDCCRADRLHSLKRLRELAQQKDEKIEFTCSLDPDSFYQMRFNQTPDMPEVDQSQLSFPLQAELQTEGAA
ncbi:MBL fold metallo-hydrolase [Litoribrevibacter albus]|uniref:MBL fold metallo-hydrolase n=1 Tax=Litoribrevibacter albus TaxID=1473156 RepID=A0AA37W825_9GAMM|nr:MBL fold metallo-hydrolase [Litoribrevibacter albus]GLQ31031.1 MBL fold metallo-hydrolase [Litoribrevibacter albus]